MESEDQLLKNNSRLCLIFSTLKFILEWIFSISKDELYKKKCFELLGDLNILDPMTTIRNLDVE
jgi:hypothetical protein